MRKVKDYALWLGNVGDVLDVRSLLSADICAVVDLAINESPAVLPRDLTYCRFPLVDGTGNPPWLLRVAVHTVAELLRANVSTLVYCGAGMSRTPAVAAAALAAVGGYSADEALTRIGGAGASDVSGVLWAEVRSAMTF